LLTGPADHADERWRRNRSEAQSDGPFRGRVPLEHGLVRNLQDQAVAQPDFKLMQRPRVLFVDDSRLMRSCAQAILGERFELLLADSAEQAWQMLLEQPGIMVVFSDLQMKGESGYWLLSRIRCCTDPALVDLPFVLITGDDDEGCRHDALQRGATDFINKPFEDTELLARATAYARSGQSARRLRLLERDHHLDSATRLGNRRYCEERLIQAMSFARRHNQPIVLMHLRLDGLSQLLEELGSPHAERALARIGRTLAERIRREDTVFRTDDEVFTFLLPATRADGARRLQERFLPDLAEMGLQPDDSALSVTAAFVVQQPDPEQIERAADLLAEGLARRAPKNDLPAPAGTVLSAGQPDLEQALALLEQGDADSVRRSLPALRRRLQPLLALLADTEQAQSAQTPNITRLSVVRRD